MKLKIEFEIDNAAFDDDGEIKNVLAEIAQQVEDGDFNKAVSPRPIRDTNGNRVGYWEITP